MNTKKITRLEVIDETGRRYIQWNCSVVVSVQDNGRTMKCFVNNTKSQSSTKKRKCGKERGMKNE